MMQRTAGRLTEDSGIASKGISNSPTTVPDFSIYNYFYGGIFIYKKEFSCAFIYLIV